MDDDPSLFIVCYCLLLTAYCLLLTVSRLVTRDRSGPYQPSMTLTALTAFFS